MARMNIRLFRFTARAEAKFWGHGITREQVEAVLHNYWVSIPNRRHRAADHLVIGLDNSGRCLTIPVLPTEDPVIWRPITAWYCKPSEAAKLR
jgi:hypothetical protein